MPYLDLRSFSESCVVSATHALTLATLRTLMHQAFDFLQPAAQASNSKQNHRSPYWGLIFVCE
ncbi:hypothetical protein CUJ84_pRLN2000295 (plasmid) [Rhizobium leguminosarum]|uniref:Uncharacterized protein n=1 Tax=Rhizobium leguminosarum TaxID=384 RepID=A0A2K9ZEZ3_RHILE|nr:hypothetical protein CUJ84_pRLN2000295 [Rhizobium leguminosarum]